MPETMDKQNVLYRTAYKIADNINWSTITKLNHGKSTPGDVVSKVKALLNDPKNKDMELKLGKIGKEGAWKLVLRVKSGSKHLYEAVLDPKYVHVSESEKGEYKNKQIKAQKEAMSEVDGIIDKTKHAISAYEVIKGRFDKIKADFAVQAKALENPKIGASDRGKILSQIKVNMNILTRMPAEVNKVFADDRDGAMAFRSGGAGRVCSNKGLDDEYGASVKMRFMEHSKLFKEFEGKVKIFSTKQTELHLSMEKVVGIAENRQSVGEATKNMLEKSLVELSKILEGAKMNTKLSELESYLKFDPKTEERVRVDGAIKTAENRLELLLKIQERYSKLVSARFAQIPPAVANDPAVQKFQRDIAKVTTDMESLVEQVQAAVTKAVMHLKDVQKKMDLGK